MHSDTSIIEYTYYVLSWSEISKKKHWKNIWLDVDYCWSVMLMPCESESGVKIKKRIESMINVRIDQRSGAYFMLD